MTMPPPTAGPVRKGLDREDLIADGWREGDDGLWRTDRFGGSYKLENALRRIGSQRGEETPPNPDQQERVFTMPESRIFHSRRDCPSLHRSNRYWPVTEETRAEAGRHYYAKTQPCKLCVS